MICISLYATFSINAQAVSTDALWDKADSLYHAGNFTGSIVEYERIVFQSKDRVLTQKAIFQKAMVYKHIGNYVKTEIELERIGIRNPKDSLFALKAYELAFAQYMRGKYKSAVNTIENYSILLDESNFNKENLFILQALAYNQLFEFDKAKASIRKISQNNAFQRNNYDRILTYYKHTPKYKNPEKARHLSILPGLGQLYCGEVFEGGINFLLNASALGFGAWQVYQGYYFTGYVVGVTLLQKFHSGGQHRAEILAKQRNKEMITCFNNKLTNEFLKIEDQKP